MPRSPGLMRPLASTAVASVITRPAPPTARDPRWTRCQAVACPSVLLYWHIGDTPIRLRRVTPRILSGEKSGAAIPASLTRRLQRTPCRTAARAGGQSAPASSSWSASDGAASEREHRTAWRGGRAIVCPPFARTEPIECALHVGTVFVHDDGRPGTIALAASVTARPGADVDPH